VQGCFSTHVRSGEFLLQYLVSTVLEKEAEPTPNPPVVQSVRIGRGGINTSTLPPLFLAFGGAGRKDWIVLPPRRGNTTPTYRTLSNQINSSMTCSISAKYIVVVPRRNRIDAPNS